MTPRGTEDQPAVSSGHEITPAGGDGVSLITQAPPLPFNGRFEADLIMPMGDEYTVPGEMIEAVATVKDVFGPEVEQVAYRGPGEDWRVKRFEERRGVFWTVAEGSAEMDLPPR